MGVRSPPKGEAMSVSEARILVVGQTSLSTLATLQRLEREGWSARSVSTIAEAEEVLKTARFDVVLASETIIDGSGYDLTNFVLLRSETLLVSVALSEASLWLPVVQQGVVTLGDRALNSSMLQLEIAELLSKSVRTRASTPSPGAADGVDDAASRELISAADSRVGPAERRGGLAYKSARQKSFLPPRRKSVAAASISIPDDARSKPETGKGSALPIGVPGGHFRQHPGRAPNHH